MPPQHVDDNDIVITPLYVLNKLDEHTKECSRRWWAVMMATIGSAFTIIITLVGLIVTIFMRGMT